MLTSRTFSSFLLVLTFLLVGSSLISFYLIFYSKKSDRFLSHPLWEKMSILIAVLFTLSTIVFISASIFTSLNDVILTHRWILYFFIYYFLVLLNLFILSIIHKVRKDLSKEKNRTVFHLDRARPNRIGFFTVFTMMNSFALAMYAWST